MPSRFPGRAILIGEKINKRFGISQVLPYSHHVHAALLEYVDLAFSKPLVQVVDIAFEITLTNAAFVDGLHPQFETA